MFVLPSRTEGLLRALLEAIARGLPCIIVTEIEGIPKLLEIKALLSVINSELLAGKIHSFLNSPELADAQAQTNLDEAHNYALERLEARRKEFYNYLEKIS